MLQTKDGGMASKAVTAADTAEAREEAAEAPLLDSIASAIKKMVARGKERGYLTYDELNAALPQDQVSSEQIEDTMTMLSELGINLIESEESEEPAEAEAEEGEAETRGNVDDDDIGRTDDPVRMYLREMGSVELLSREGEIAIAKRIEAGRDMMIGGLCESTQTFKAIVAWHEAVKDGRMLLRDVIDLEATASADNPEPAAQPDPEEEFEEGEEGEGVGLSLSALEEKLKPDAFAAFEAIEALYGRFAELSARRMEAYAAGRTLGEPDERAYDGQRQDLVAAVQ